MANGGWTFLNKSFSADFSLKFLLAVFTIIYFWYGMYSILNSENKQPQFQNLRMQPQTVKGIEFKQNRRQNNTKVRHKICPMFTCGTCGMGNFIFQFASAFGIALHLNMKLIIAKNDIFNKIFQLSSEHIEIYESRSVCNTMDIVQERYGCCAFDSQFRNLDNARNHRIRDYLHSWKYFEGYEQELRKQLIFKNSFQNIADKMISNSIRKHNLQPDIVLVGIHVRRGDMVKKFHRGYNVAPTEYFLKSVSYMSNKINKTILFLIATNDRVWTYKNIVSNTELSGYNFELLENKRPEVDFAVLSNCDHVITSVGTFGWWTAWIANGITTYYKWPVRPKTPVGSQYSQNFSDFFYPNWIGLS